MNKYKITKVTVKSVTVVFTLKSGKVEKKIIKNYDNLTTELGKVEENDFDRLISSCKFLLTDDQYNKVMKTYCPNDTQKQESLDFVKQFDSWYENPVNIAYLKKLEDEMTNDKGFLSNSCF